VSLSFARRIARFCRTIAPLAADASVERTVLRSLVDSLACMAGAADAPAVRIARRVAEDTQAVTGAGVPAASVVGGTARVTVDAAAFVNGLAIRYLDYNDIYLSREAVHPSDVIGVALALAEGYGLDGPRLLGATTIGYEVHCRLADAICTRRGGWDHVVLNALASAVTAGVLIDLTEDQLAEAIAIAAAGNLATLETRAGTLSMWKAAAAAYAGRAGVFAALHARAGLTGPAHALEGGHGLLAHVDPEHLAFDDTLGAARLLRTHLKAWPIGYFTQPAVDAALRLRGEVDVARTRAILIETSAYGRLANADGPEKWHPATRETADHSLPYGVAVALLDGEVRERQFRPDRIAADDAARLMALTEVRENAAFTRAYPAAVSARVTLTHDDGRKIARQIDHPRGHANDPMTVDEINAKFADLVPSIDAALLERLWLLPQLDAAALARALRAVFSAGGVDDRAR